MRNDYEVRGDVTAIFLRVRDGDPAEALIDTVDLPRFLALDARWYRLPYPPDRAYAVCEPRDMLNMPRRVRMHRFILNAASERDDIDHINHNGLDNRRCNLRVVSRSYNMLNRRGNDANNTSGYRGVSFEADRGTYSAIVFVGGKRFRWRGFASPEAAALIVRDFLWRIDPVAAKNYPSIPVTTHQMGLPLGRRGGLK